LTALRDFDGLDAFARSRRSPIGYEAFVRHLVATRHLREAASYVIRCDAPKRVELYVICEDWRAAGRECKERGDKKGLEYVFLVLAAAWQVVLIPAKSTEETVSKLVDRSRTGYSKRLDEVKVTWQHVAPRLSLLLRDASNV
jgi:hypothetical protein